MKGKVLFLPLLMLVVAFSHANSQAKPQTDLTIGINLEPPHLDPTSGAAGIIDEVLLGNVFEGLTRVDEQGNVLPALAKIWKSFDGGKTFLFQLHEGVKFHDGTDFNAQDVKYSLERARDEKSVNAQKNLLKDIDKIEILNPYALKIRLTRKNSDFPFILAFGDFVIVGEESAARNKHNPIGTGPFQFERWKKGLSITIVQNLEWRGSPPAIKKVTFRIIPDLAASISALFSGDIDAFPFFQSPESLQRIKESNKFKISLGWTEGETILAVNHRRFPFNNLKIRKAITQAIEKKDVIEGATFGLGMPIGSHCQPQSQFCKELLKTLPYSPEKAKQLLNEAGVTKKIHISLALPPPLYARRSGEIIAIQLRKIGLIVTTIPMGWAEWLEKVFLNHDFDLTIISHTEPGDIDIYAQENYYLGYNNPEFNRIIKKINTADSSEEQKLLLQKAQKILSEDVAAIFLFSLPKIGVWNKSLTGFYTNSPIQVNDLRDVKWTE